MAKKSSTFDSTSLLQYMFPKDMRKYFEITNAEEEHTGKYDETKTEIVILHVYFNGFQKKTQKTPQSEINKAIQIKKEYYAGKK